MATGVNKYVVPSREYFRSFFTSASSATFPAPLVAWTLILIVNFDNPLPIGSSDWHHFFFLLGMAVVHLKKKYNITNTGIIIIIGIHPPEGKCHILRRNHKTSEQNLKDKHQVNTTQFLCWCWQSQETNFNHFHESEGFP